MELVNTAQKFSFSFSKLRYCPFREIVNIKHIKWNWISSMKFETVRIYLVKWRFWFVVWSKNFATVTSPLLAKKQQQQPGTCAAHFFVHFFDVVLHDYNVKLYVGICRMCSPYVLSGSCSLFSTLPLIFTLLVAFSHFLTANFHVFEICLLFFV